MVAGIPRGEVVTYAEVAEEASHPRSSQAVSNVLRRVPDLPWWRVISSNGRLYAPTNRFKPTSSERRVWKSRIQLGSLRADPA